MSKVDIKRLDSVTKNDTTATEQINDNFQALQAAIENTVSRDGTVPNYMDADLDLNSYRIINAGDPVNKQDVVTVKYFEEKAGGAIEAAAEAKASASKAASSAQSALVASNNAIGQVAKAEADLLEASNLLNQTNQFVAESVDNINATVEAALEGIKKEAVDAAESVIEDVVGAYTDRAETAASAADIDAASANKAAKDARTWATGEDAEVQLLEANEHSSRGYADIAMAIANAPEDTPIDDSKLMALEVIRVVGELSGDNTINGTLNVKDDSNHPLKVTGLAGASASGFQVVDSNRAGESDFEHYATGDRYGTRIANKSTRTGKTVNIDLYQTTAGKSVLDLSKPDTILAPQLLDILFPIGSYYLSEEAECPLGDWMEQCQWELVATKVDEMTVNVFRRTM